MDEHGIKIGQVAAAVDTPLIAIYGSSTPDHTPPMSDRASIVKLDIECSPCFERTCPLGHFDCMNRLKPTTVHDRVVELLGLLPQPARQATPTG